MAVNLSPVGGVAGQFFDNNGDPLVGGKLFTYAAGTTTPQVTYTSSSGGTPNSNPIILNAGGRVPAEIWLTDGLSYKFVLYSATDQLIGSWDDISGINSNFVNFTSSQEIQTATSGQTVFTLTTMQYQPGTNSLTVYVDGVNQYGPGAPYAYVETNSTTVTFNAGLHVGAEVKFTTVEQATSSATDAASVAYTPAGTGAVTTNVQAKLRETVSVKDFGAVGDGVTDDTAAIQAAIDAVASSGGSLYVPEGTYKCTSQINLKSNVTIIGEGKSSAFYATPSGGSQTFLFVASNQSNVVVDSVRLYGASTAAQDLTTAIFLTDGSTNCTVKNCYIDTCYLGALIGNVSTTSASYCSIINNTISNIGCNGAGVNSFGDENKIDENLIYNFGQLASISLVTAGIEFRGSRNGSCSNNIIKNGDFGSGAYSDGIRIEFAVEGATQNPTGIVASNNIIESISGHGFRLQYPTNSVITNNIIKNVSEGSGILILGSSTQAVCKNNTISNNTISNVAKDAGIKAESVSGFDIENNIISSNVIRSCFYGITARYFSSNLVANNFISDCDSGGISHFSGNENNYTGNQCINNVSHGIAVVAGDKNTLTANTSLGNTTQGIYNNGTDTLLFGGQVTGNGTNFVFASPCVGIINTTDGLSFFGEQPSSKKTVTGSKGGNVALANLLVSLRDYGLIVDSTT